MNLHRREESRNVRWQGKILLLLLLFSVSVLLFGFPSYAASNGVVSGATSLNIRSGPGTSYENITSSSGRAITLPNGYSVTILEDVRDEEEEDYIWYRISFIYDGSVQEGYA